MAPDETTMSATPSGPGRRVDATERRGGGLRRIPALLGRLLDAPARRRGLAQFALLEQWPLIVGADLARRCQPLRLRRGPDGPVLQLRLNGATALEVQHTAPLIVERINDHFGFEAVTRLRLIQAPPGGVVQKRRAAVRPLSVAAAAEIEAAVADIAEPPLRAALASLGRALREHPPASRE